MLIKTLVAQWYRIHLPVQETQETRVGSFGWEDALEKEMVTHSSILAWEIQWTERAWLATFRRIARESDMT